MATLYITEIAALSFDPHGNNVMAPGMPPLIEQSLPIGGASAASNPFSPATRYVMVHADTSCCLAWGVGPVAVLGAQRLGANETRFYGVKPGDEIAVIQSP